MTYRIGDKVKVRDPDGAKWLGIIDAPSVLWDDWYVVRRLRPGYRTGKRANYHVHTSEMRKQK